MVQSFQEVLLHLSAQKDLNPALEMLELPNLTASTTCSTEHLLGMVHQKTLTFALTLMNAL